MRPTLRLGKIAGIPVGVNGGVLVIIALVAIGLAFGRLPAAHPGRATAAYVVAGLLAAVLFVASLLAHELAHAVVARAKGVEVEGITLWLLGGVAQLRNEARSPGIEFIIAVVGPATSLALGGIFGGVAIGLDAVGAGGLPAAVVGYLATVNIALAVFNLVPAAPLDGGRVLRAAVWRGTGDRVRAAQVAAGAGRLFGLVLIVAGVAQILFGGLGGLWLALVGWFLVQAASAEAEQAVLGQRLHGVRVGDVMTTSPIPAAPGTPIAAFINDVVLHRPHSTYPLVDGIGQLTGLVTLNRIRRVPIDQRSTVTLADIACPPDLVPTARADEPLVSLLARMSGCSDGRAVVTDVQGRVVGIVSPSDISQTVTLADMRATDPYPPRGADLNTTFPPHRTGGAADGSRSARQSGRNPGSPRS
jgi:Zn-dependent protease/CBS domain-containing protein